jgi:hypothetical protein
MSAIHISKLRVRRGIGVASFRKPSLCSAANTSHITIVMTMAAIRQRLTESRSLRISLLDRGDVEVADVYEVAGYGGGCGH